MRGLSILLGNHVLLVSNFLQSCVALSLQRFYDFLVDHAVLSGRLLQTRHQSADQILVPGIFLKKRLSLKQKDRVFFSLESTRHQNERSQPLKSAQWNQYEAKH